MPPAPPPSVPIASAVDFERLETFRLTGDKKNRYAPPSLTPAPHSSFTSLARASSAGESNMSILFAGNQSGSILLWRLTELNKFGGAKRTERNSEVLKSTMGHCGSVTCLLYSEAEIFTTRKRGLLFSGSADRTIKVWDIWTCFERSGNVEPCLQTLAGHGSTITSLIDCEVNGNLISTSLDKTMKVWQPEPGRSVLLNPFFICTRTLPVVGASSPDTWFSAAALRPGEDWALFCGDGEGSVHVYGRVPPDPMAAKDPEAPLAVLLKKRWSNVHRLLISAVHLVAEQNFLVTISYDCDCCVLDSISGSVFMTVSSASRCRYTGVCWDVQYEQLLLCTADGHVEAHNVYVERLVGGDQVPGGKDSKATPGGAGKKSAASTGRVGGGAQQPPARGQHAEPVVSSMIWVGDNRFLIMFPSDCCVQEWSVKRNLECIQFPGHDDEVVGIVVVSQADERATLMQSMAGASTVIKGAAGFRPEESAIFSCSLDNTIRCWDEYDVTQRYKLDEKETEISALSYASRFNLIVTGGDDGTVKFWNPDSGHNRVERDHTNTVTCIETTVTARMDLVMTSSFDGTIAVYDIRQKKEGAPTLLEHIMSDFPPSGSDSKKGGKRAEVKQGGAADKLFDLALDANSEILTLHYHDESGTLISGGNDRILRAWDVVAGSLVMKWDSQHSEPLLSLTGDASFLLCGSSDGTVSVWNLGGHTLEDYLQDMTRSKMNNKMRRQALIECHPGHSVSAITIIPHSGNLVTAGSDGKINIWDYSKRSESGDDGILLKTLRHHKEIPKCLSYKAHIGDNFASLFVGTKEGSILKFTLANNLDEKAALNNNDAEEKAEEKNSSLNEEDNY